MARAAVARPIDAADILMTDHVEGHRALGRGRLILAPLSERGRATLHRTTRVARRRRATLARLRSRGLIVTARRETIAADVPTKTRAPNGTRTSSAYDANGGNGTRLPRRASGLLEPPRRRHRSHASAKKTNIQATLRERAEPLEAHVA